MAVIELSGLRKEYQRFRRPPIVALDGLDLSVSDGGVFGFLGPNGSGKTTTIRCLLALARPTSGDCRVLAYFLVIENVVGSFLENFRRWLVLGNAIVLVSGENSGGEVAGRSVPVAALYLTAVAIGLLAAATVVFRRRDVA